MHLASWTMSSRSASVSRGPAAARRCLKRALRSPPSSGVAKCQKARGKRRASRRPRAGALVSTAWD